MFPNYSKIFSAVCIDIICKHLVHKLSVHNIKNIYSLFIERIFYTVEQIQQVACKMIYCIKKRKYNVIFFPVLNSLISPKNKGTCLPFNFMFALFSISLTKSSLKTSYFSLRITRDGLFRSPSPKTFFLGDKKLLCIFPEFDPLITCRFP